MTSKSILSMASVGAALFLGSLGSANAAVTFPSVGADTGGPALIITLNPGGTGTITAGPSNGTAYDGVEDTYIGVVNLSGQTISAIQLNGAQGVDIFGFDGDGVGKGTGTGSGTYTGTGIQQYGTPNSSDSSGYGGPIGFFTNINTSNEFTTGEVGVLNFVGGLASGSSATGSCISDAFCTWFSLEEPLDAASFTAQVTTTPLPETWTMLLIGLVGLGFVRYWAPKSRSAGLAAA
jgi:hypothetical protein